MNDDELIRRKKVIFNRRWSSLMDRLNRLGRKLPNEGFREELWEKFRDTNFCEYCGCELNYWVKQGDNLKDAIRSPSIDHGIALKKGGDNSLDNLVITCQGCNLFKGTISQELYIDLCNLILRNGRPGMLEDLLIQAYMGARANKLERVAQEEFELFKIIGTKAGI
jgi:5-methylcytosine-specific restriction endonuclease McrA